MLKNSVELTQGVSSTLTNLLLQNEVAKLVIKTVLDSKELQGEYTLEGEFKLIKKDGL